MELVSFFILERDAIMLPYTKEVAAYYVPFHCDDTDVDEFFATDAFYYDKELLGKTYAWINSDNPSFIIALLTLANDSIKAKDIISSLGIECKEALLMQNAE